MTDDLELLPDELSEGDSGENELTVRMAAARFSGPLPPPDVPKQYEEIEPGAAGRIISMAESRLAHENEMEQRAIAIAASAFEEQE